MLSAVRRRRDVTNRRAHFRGRGRRPLAPSLTGRRGARARAFFPAEPLLDALNATSARNHASHRPLRFADREVDATVCRDADGRLIVGLPTRRSTLENRSDSSRGRWPARPTPRALLEILCDAAPRSAARTARPCSSRRPTKASSSRRSAARDGARPSFRAAGVARARSAADARRRVGRRLQRLGASADEGRARAAPRPDASRAADRARRDPRRARRDARRRRVAVLRARGAPAARHRRLRRARAVEGRAARAGAGRRSRQEPLPRDRIARAAYAAHGARRLRGAARRPGDRSAVGERSSTCSSACGRSRSISRR